MTPVTLIERFRSVPPSASPDPAGLGLWHDDGTRTTGRTASSTGAAGSPPGACGQLGLQPGDRVLTWCPSDARPARGLFRGDAGAARPRPARPADERRRDRGHRRAAPSRATSSSARAATRPTRAPAGLADVPDDDRRRPRRRARTTTFPADWEAQRRGLGATAPGRRLGPDLHVGHDRHAEGRDGRPRQPARDARARSTRASRRSTTGSSRSCPLTPPVRAGDRADLRAERRRRHPLRPEPQPAGPVRGAPRPPGHEHDRRAPGARPVLERDRARGRQAGPARALRPPPADRPAPPLPPPGG